MITDRKKRKLRGVIERVRRQLGLHDYRLTIRFLTAGDDPELKDLYALVHVDDIRKTIYVKFNETNVRSMSEGWLRRLALHELLHSFFWELDSLLENIMYKSDFSEYRKQAFRNRFTEIEHRKIFRLVRVLAPYSHRLASEPLKPLPKPKRRRKTRRKVKRKRASKRSTSRTSRTGRKPRSRKARAGTRKRPRSTARKRRSGTRSRSPRKRPSKTRTGSRTSRTRKRSTARRKTGKGRSGRRS